MEPMIDADSPAAAGGTQSLDRALQLLQAVAAHGADGARLADLVAAAGLSKATAHRLLSALARGGLVEQDGASRRYHLGAAVVELGRLAALRHPPAPGSAFLRPDYRGDVVLADLLCDRHARAADADRAALLHESVAGHTTELSFARLAADSARLATVLAGLGVGRGDRVAMLLPKGAELLIAALAVWRLGGVAMPLFTTYTRQALAERLADAGPGAIVTNGFLCHKIPRDTPGPVVAVEGDGAQGTPHAVPFWSALHAARPWSEPARYAEGDPFVLLYTSRAEPQPLGVALPVKALPGIEQYMRVGLDLRDDDIYWNMGDPAWAYGAYYGLVGPLLLGRTTILCDGPFDVRQGYRVLAKFGVTNLTAAPSQMRAWHRADAAAAPRRLALRLVSVVGEPLPADLVAWATQTLRVPLRDQYGQRETGIILVNRYGPGGTARPGDGSLGRPMPGYRVVVLDPDGREAPVGGAGEIAIDVEQSPLFWFDGYVNSPERTAQRFRHGRRYYLTGDAAFRDADGMLHYRGRVSDEVLMQEDD